jgi:hypothetical protein
MKASSCCMVSDWSEPMFFSASLHGGARERRRVVNLWSKCRRRWSSDTIVRATSSAADVCMPTQLSLRWLLFSLAVIMPILQYPSGGPIWSLMRRTLFSRSQVLMSPSPEKTAVLCSLCAMAVTENLIAFF